MSKYLNKALDDFLDGSAVLTFAVIFLLKLSKQLEVVFQFAHSNCCHRRWNGSITTRRRWNSWDAWCHHFGKSETGAVLAEMHTLWLFEYSPFSSANLNSSLPAWSVKTIGYSTSTCLPCSRHVLRIRRKGLLWSFLLGSALRRFICLFAVGLFLVGVANWTFWDAKWSQIGILGCWLVVNWHSWDADWFVRCMGSTSLKVSHGDGETRNYGFGLSGQSVPPQVDSDKLRNELRS